MGSNSAFRSYVSLLTTVSLGLVLWATLTTTDLPAPSLIAGLLVTYVAVELFQLVLPSGAAISFGSALSIAAVVLLGPRAAVVLQAVGVLVVGALSRARPERLSINLSHFVLSVAVAGLVFEGLGGSGRAPLAQGGIPLALATGALWATQLGLGTVAMSLYKPRPLMDCLRDLWGLPVGLSLAAAGSSMPLVAAMHAVGSIVPLVGAAAAAAMASALLRRAARLSQQRTLMGILPLTHTAGGDLTRTRTQLIRLVSLLAGAIGLGSQERDALQWSALIHNVGQSEPEIAVHAGLEPATPEQARMLKEHTVRAAAQVGRIGSLLWVARILGTHHERYNGWGYPRGLRGDEIPFPAVLLGLAEAYLALTTPCAYRPQGMDPAGALGLLKAQSGEQFHPRAIAALEKVLQESSPGESDAFPSRQPVEEVVARLRRATIAPCLPGSISDLSSKKERTQTGGLLRATLLSVLPTGAFRRVDRRTADWYRSLYELGQLFSSSLEVGSLAAQTTQVVHNLTTQPCEVCLVGQDGETLETVATHGMPHGCLVDFGRGVHLGLSGVAFSEHRPVVSHDLRTDPRLLRPFGDQKVEDVRSCVVVPLTAAGVPLGTICVYSRDERSFPPPEVQALVAIANVASLAFQNANLYRKAGERLAQLLRTQCFLQTVLDTAPVGIFAFDRDGALSMANREAAFYLGALGYEVARGDKELVLTLADFRDMLGLGRPAAHPETLGGPGSVATSVDLPTGPVCFQVWSSPLEEGASGRTGTLIVVDDVTRARRLEQEVRRKERLASIGELAARAAHEIRNPLSSLQGFSQLLTLYCPVREQWPECAIFLERLGSEVERLEDIVQSMLVMARPAPINLRPGDLAEPVIDVLGMLAARARQSGVRMRGPARTTGVEINYDTRQIKQVVLNLIQNAIDAVAGPGGPPPGEREVVVDLGTVHRDGRDMALLQVSDNGPGLRSGDESRAFVPFFTTKDTGTGLGLPVCRGIVEAHGGTLCYRSREDHGAVFEVLLPV